MIVKEITNVTVDGKPLKVYLEEEKRSEIEAHTSREIYEKASGIGYQPGTGKFTNISGSRSERRDYITPISISEEVAAKVNFIAKYKGEKALTEFLNSAVDKQVGPIEAARNETREQKRILLQKRQELETDINRCEAAEEALSNAIAIMTGKARIAGNPFQASTPSGRVPRGSRHAQIKQILSVGPMEFSELRSKLEAMGCPKASTYPAIDGVIRAGKAERDGDIVAWIGD